VRLLFVVPGPAAFLGDAMAGLAARGHDVTLLTAAPAWTGAAGIAVHELPVAPGPWLQTGARLHRRVSERPWAAAPHVQREWIRHRGPLLPAAGDWIAERAAAFDLAVFAPCASATTWAGVPLVHAPVVLHPALRDEPALHLPVVDVVLRMAGGLVFASSEEAALAGRFVRTRPWLVVDEGSPVALDRYERFLRSGARR